MSVGDTIVKSYIDAKLNIQKYSGLLFATWFGVETPDVPKLEAISEAGDVVTLVNEVLTFIASLGGVVAVAMILYGGWLYVSSSGDSEKTKQAQGTITNAIIALIIIFALRMILNFVIELVYQNA